ncbi:hypothetical protein [Caballeronia sp. GaOx3]|uniref:hypothetical protein n=1 Tax=Caballeronia sp. GaOx3 TaxID=2921740 RepID=UPI0020290E8C|nr:hypothetical protein [Caballeronia sp. GaOx3]
MTRLLICVLFCAELAACARLQVDVSILDRRYWASAPRLRDSIANEVADINEKRVSGQFFGAQEDIKRQVRTALDELAGPKSGYKLSALTVNTVYASMSHNTDQSFSQAGQYYSKAFTELIELQNSDLPYDTTQLLSIQREIDAGNGELRSLADSLSVDLRKAIGLDVSPGRKDTRGAQTIAQTERSITSKINSIVGINGILNDPLASSVVYAPESFWKRPESPYGINNTYASGIFGNADIAVKMESVGSFTIKGVRLDTSKITQATFATGRQTIKAVAAVYGIPLPAPGAATAPGPASGAVVPEVDIGFASPEEQRDNAQMAMNRARVAKLNVISAILAQRNALQGSDDTQRATAVNIVKSVFNANRGEFAAGSSNAQK